MTLDTIRMIDATGSDNATGCTVLTIIDYWDWQQGEHEHLLALQEKFNAYFEFVESGQLFEERPSAAGVPVRLDVVSRHPFSPAAVDLLNLLSGVARRELDIEVTWGHVLTTPDA